MPRGKKGGNPTSNPSKKSKSTEQTKRPDAQKPIDESSTTSAPRRGTRTGLRSQGTTEPARPLGDNPESILRNRRKGQGAKQPKKARGWPRKPARSHPDHPVQSVEAIPEEYQSRIDYSLPTEDSNEEASLGEQDIDPEEAFNRKWGYLPPLDEEAAAIIDAIMADPTKAKGYARISPTHPDFQRGLRRRNVLLKKNRDHDPHAGSIDDLPQISLQETDAERETYEKLWAMDQDKCVNGSNEALFQRTLMMSFIARHCLIYRRDASKPFNLDFSVEEAWTCPPMPSRDYEFSNKLLTQPKPDLAVYFCREKLISDGLWDNMPNATQRLACYERPDLIGGDRAFHFFTIEGKRSQTSTDDNTAMFQSLNNASQALHNMFEFFQDAGPHHREKFFSEVRIFSAVASTEGLNIRIHRAIEVPENSSKYDFVVPGYPLRFEFREFANVKKHEFERKTVLEIFARILVGYGVEKLHGLLQNAAKDLVENLNRNPDRIKSREDKDFYRHGQVDKTPRSSNIPTAGPSRNHSVQSTMSVDTVAWNATQQGSSSNMAAPPRPNPSFHMLSERTTPTQSQPPPSSAQVSSSPSAKRRRTQGEDGKSPRRTRTSK